jgi:hypothetical protein
VTNPETVLAQNQGSGKPPPFALQNNYATINDASLPLRLSTPGWANFSPNNLRGIETPELLFEIAKEKIITRIQPFAKRVRLFVERYFDFMQNHVESNSDRLPSDPLLTSLDWIYSVWLPLPHAKLLVSQNDNSQSAHFVEFDIVFWTGQHLLGIQVEQKGTMVKSKNKLMNEFATNQTQFKSISIARDQLPDNEQKFPNEMFDENFLNFWSEVKLPKGPPIQQNLNLVLPTQGIN